MNFRLEFVFNSNTSPAINVPGSYDALVTVPSGGIGSYAFPAADTPGSAFLVDNAFGGGPLYAAWGLSTNPQPSLTNFASRASFVVSPGATLPVLLPQSGENILYFTTGTATGQVGLFGGTLRLVYDAGTIIVTPGLPT